MLLKSCSVGLSFVPEAQTRRWVSMDEDDASLAAPSEVDARKELNDLQIQAYFSLVENVKVNNHARKLLYLTNSQASKLAEKIKSIDHFCLSMGIDPRPQFVVILRM